MNYITAEILFVFIPYLKPHNVTLIPQLDLIFKMWKIIATIWVITKIIRKKRISKKTLSILPFCIVWIVSMYINNSISKDVINGIMTILGIHMYYECYRENTYIYEKLVLCLGKIAKIYLICQTITMLLIDGPLFGKVVGNMSDRFFLGGDNLSAFIMIVLTTVMFYSDEKKNNKITRLSWTIFIFEVISLVKQFAGAAMVSFLIFFVLVVFRNNKKIIKWITPMKMIIISIVFVGLVAYGDLASSMNGLLTKVGKVGFNGRTEIWFNATKAIMQKPLLGYGSVANTYMIENMLNHTNHTHSIVLEFLFETGIIGVITFGFYLKNNLKSIKNINKLLLIGISVYILNAIFDFYITSIYFYLLILIIIWDCRLKNHLEINKNTRERK